MTAPCAFCGGPYSLQVGEVDLEARTFTVEACCELAREDAAAWLAEPAGSPFAAPRREVCTWFRRETGLELRAIVPDPGVGLRFGNGGLVLDFGLELGAVDLQQAKAFVRQHHRHSRPPVSWRWGHALRNGPDLVAVAMVGRPVARMLDPRTVVEVNRVCVDPGLGRLGWNACSMLYGAAAREARRRGFRRVVTYTLESELGASLRAAGWRVVAAVKKSARGWDRPSRRRAREASPRKVRWELEFER